MHPLEWEPIKDSPEDSTHFVYDIRGLFTGFLSCMKKSPEFDGWLSVHRGSGRKTWYRRNHMDASAKVSGWYVSRMPSTKTG
jgi:hypothetical protein